MRELAAPLAQRLPVNLRSQFEAAAAFNDDQQSEVWDRYVMALMNMFLAPGQVMAMLDGETARFL